MTPGLSAFDPRWAVRLAPLVFRARGPADGGRTGRHPGVRRGGGGDFLDQRPYVPGDDRRRIDWRVFARTDRWTVREERDDADRRVLLALDVSRSMSYVVPPRPAKIRFAAGLLAALAHVLRRGREAAGLVFFDDAARGGCPLGASPDAWDRLDRALAAPPEGGQTDYRVSSRGILAALPPRAAAVVVSDFLGALDGLADLFRALRVGGRDVTAFQVVDPVEQRLAAWGPRRFVDLESGRTIRADAAAVAASYNERFARRQAALAALAGSLGVDHALFTTGAPVDEQLARCLLQRDARHPR